MIHGGFQQAHAAAEVKHHVNRRSNKGGKVYDGHEKSKVKSKNSKAAGRKQAFFTFEFLI